VIRFVNVMGDRNLPLPGSGNSVSAPRAIAVELPPAPSGLAHDPANGSVGPTISIHKSKKDKKKTAATPTAANGKSPAAASGNTLNLSEPAAPALSPEAEKAPPEPDEPPTVNIYPTTPSTSPPGSASGTNTNPSPAPPSTH